MIFGLDPYDQGTVVLQGSPLPRQSPRTSVQRGLALLTENRRDEGLLPDNNIESNVALASLARFANGAWGVVSASRLRQAVADATASLAVACRDRNRQPVKTLSGGNQQKVVLAKWLLAEASVLILDEPTRGVDVGAREQVYKEINRLAEEGAAILLISSEIEELIGMCDRILVLSGGRLQADVPRGQFDRNLLMRAALAEAA